MCAFWTQREVPVGRPAASDRAAALAAKPVGETRRRLHRDAQKPWGDFTTRLATLPADAKVSAQNSIVPHLPRLAQVSVFPKGASEADLIVLDRARTPWPLSEPEFAAVINGLKGSRAYYPLVDDGRFLLLSRKGLTTPLVAPIT